ncbi:ixoderin B, putative, partial [Ixodes scapularis]
GKRAVSCSQLKRLGNDVTSEYLINPHRGCKVKCDMETNGGGWTVIQRRGGSETFEENLFERTEKEYQDGFGAGATSYWIGKSVLRLRDKEEISPLLFSYFHCAHHVFGFQQPMVNSSEHQINCGNGSPKHRTSYDALKTYNGYEFFMGDSQFMEPYSGCYPPLSGGWWYNECLRSNLNGRKLQSTDSKNKRGLGITWFKDGDRNSYDAIYDQVEMKIRDADFDFCTGKMATYSDI